jgi:xylulokinase
MLKRNLEVLQEMGIQINEVISLGGAAKSNLWLKIKADVVNKKFVTVECDEAACLGIAMLSGVASGIFKNLEQAVKKMVHIKDTVLPDKKNNKIYEKAYKRYLEIYNTAENIYYEKEKQK